MRFTFVHEFLIVSDYLILQTFRATDDHLNHGES